MKESIKSNAPRFSTLRMLKEYLNSFYVNALKKA
jgi:glucan phosphorylase